MCTVLERKNQNKDTQQHALPASWTYIIQYYIVNTEKTKVAEVASLVGA